MIASATTRLEQVLQTLTVRAWRLRLERAAVPLEISVLRGVWGMALREVSPRAYEDVFAGGNGSPRYILRPVSGAMNGRPEFEFLLFGPPDDSIDTAVWAAWGVAGHRGLGKQRKPFGFAAVQPLAWDGTPTESPLRQPGFHLARLPRFEAKEDCPCQLRFDDPLRLLRDDRLIRRPTVADLTIAALRRIHSLTNDDELWAQRYDWLERARSVAAEPWRGRRLDFHRYSSSQRREVEQWGVAGELALPHGPGPLAPLLAAAEWTHLGKGTVMGLGRMRIINEGQYRRLWHARSRKAKQPVSDGSDDLRRYV